MVDPNSSKFISSLVKSLQMFCHGYMDFEDSIEIIGHINLRIDNRQKLDYIVNEQVSKQGQESTCFHSNSYHSLPPVQHSERGGSRSGDLPLDTSMAMLAGARVQVDLSGPSPVTRSTFSSYPDGFLSPVGNNSQAIDSQPQDTQQTSVVGSSIKDLSWDAQVSMINHSQASDSAASLAGVGQSCSVGGGVDNGRTDTGMAVTSDGDGQQQSVSGLLQDIVIKADPDAIPSPETQAAEEDANSSSSSTVEEMPLHFEGLKTDPYQPELADNDEPEDYSQPKRRCSESGDQIYSKKPRLQTKPSASAACREDRDVDRLPDRKMGPTCQSSLCRKSKTRGCSFITQEERTLLFNQFWAIRTWKERRSYVKSCVVGLPVKHRQSEPPEGSRRHNSFVYHFIVNGFAVNVCKTMFCNTLGLSARTVGAWNSEDSGCGIAWEGAFAGSQEGDVGFSGTQEGTGFVSSKQDPSPDTSDSGSVTVLS